jgi:hypothetical protein
MRCKRQPSIMTGGSMKWLHPVRRSEKLPKHQPQAMPDMISRRVARIDDKVQEAIMLEKFYCRVLQIEQCYFVFTTLCLFIMPQALIQIDIVSSLMRMCLYSSSVTFLVNGFDIDKCCSQKSDAVNILLENE